ncbi:hypothetical protein BC830DRAFT_1147335 [Chytriomyces sp. MP71]|nr:hypothetical protein BC830DRAFT_1147335 [Chytriomyces sp. MP71]
MDEVSIDNPVVMQSQRGENLKSHRHWVEDGQAGPHEDKPSAPNLLLPNCKETLQYRYPCTPPKTRCPSPVPSLRDCESVPSTGFNSPVLVQTCQLTDFPEAELLAACSKAISANKVVQRFELRAALAVYAGNLSHPHDPDATPRNSVTRFSDISATVLKSLPSDPSRPLNSEISEIESLRKEVSSSAVRLAALQFDLQSQSRARSLLETQNTALADENAKLEDEREELVCRVRALMAVRTGVEKGVQTDVVELGGGGECRISAAAFGGGLSASSPAFLAVGSFAANSMMMDDRDVQNLASFQDLLVPSAVVLAPPDVSPASSVARGVTAASHIDPHFVCQWKIFGLLDKLEVKTNEVELLTVMNQRLHDQNGVLQYGWRMETREMRREMDALREEVVRSQALGGSPSPRQGGSRKEWSVGRKDGQVLQVPPQNEKQASPNDAVFATLAGEPSFS